MKNELELTVENLAFWAEEKLEPIMLALFEDRLDAGALLELCQLHRQWAIGRLLSALDVDDFHRGLRKSVQAYGFMLRQKQRGFTVEPYHACTSRAEPFWDALASEDWQAIPLLATHTPRDWRADMEAEADFRYMSFVMGLAAGGSDESQLEEALSPLARACGMSESSRVELCTALLRGDAAGLAQALEQHMEARRISLDALSGTDSLPPQVQLTEAFVSIEGVALLKLASRRGLSVPPPSHGVPDVALHPPAPSLQLDDPWRILETELPAPPG